jgi:hypothetical protein
MLKFGAVEAVKEEYRAERGLLFIENLLQDARYAIRSLPRTPGLTIVIITLALGIGITSSIFWYARCADLQALPCAASAHRGYVGEHDTRYQLRTFLLSRISGHPRQNEELRRCDRRKRYAGGRLQCRTRSHAAA